MKNGILVPKFCPSIFSHASAVGKKEHAGPLGSLFDFHDETDRFGQETWEQSESEMQHVALNLALTKAGLSSSGIDAVFAGDLINQCTGSSFGLLDVPSPYFGLYGACSTSAEALILATLYLNATGASTVAAVTSSHNCTAERQFRFPVEYAALRTPTSQWTVTGAAAFLLGDGPGAYITSLLPGRIVDRGVTDANNMGAAMAPAAFDTLSRYFSLSGSSPSDFDGIFTGDLGYEGHAILTDSLSSSGFPTSNFFDCGLLIYDREKQDAHAGGSGCGCSACVLSSFLLPKLERGEFHDILFVATGALMSRKSLLQGNSIPGIAHLIRITKERNL